MLLLSCPHCSRKIQVKEELAGQQVRCPHCRQALTVPAMPPSAVGKGAGAVGPLDPGAPTEAPTVLPADARETLSVPEPSGWSARSPA